MLNWNTFSIAKTYNGKISFETLPICFTSSAEFPLYSRGCVPHCLCNRLALAETWRSFSLRLVCPLPLTGSFIHRPSAQNTTSPDDLNKGEAVSPRTKSSRRSKKACMCISQKVYLEPKWLRYSSKLCRDIITFLGQQNIKKSRTDNHRPKIARDSRSHCKKATSPINNRAVASLNNPQVLSPKS